MSTDPETTPPPQSARPIPPPRRRIRSEDLLCGQTEIVIVHGSEEYVLRLTRNGKLILNK